MWAALLVIAAGLGPFPGALALPLHTTGVLGRLFAEALENAPKEPYRSLCRHGVGPIAAFSYGLLPLIIPQLTSYTLYRWETTSAPPPYSAWCAPAAWVPFVRPGRVAWYPQRTQTAVRLGYHDAPHRLA